MKNLIKKIQDGTGGNIQEKLNIIGDKINQRILGYLLENEKAFFNQMSRDLSEQRVVSRRTLYGRLMEMENAGILVSEMVSLDYGEKHIQRWVKEYHISNKHLPWMREVLST